MTAGLQSFAEWYLGGPFSPYARSHRLAGSAALMIEAAQPAGDFSDPAVSDLVLIRALSPGMRQASDLGGGRFEDVGQTDDLFLVAPGVATRIDVHTPHVIQLLAIPGRLVVDHLLDGGPGPDVLEFGHLHAGPFRDDHVTATMKLLWQEAAHGDRTATLFADGAVLALVARLARLARRAGSPRPAGRLAGWQVRRVLDYLGDNLATRVRLAELAEIARLSPHHFCRAFRASTGLPPHRMHTRMRLERAQDLLVRTELGIAEVAAAVGYDDPGQFGRAFRKGTGLSPTEYRRRALR